MTAALCLLTIFAQQKGTQAGGQKTPVKSAPAKGGPGKSVPGKSVPAAPAPQSHPTVNGLTAPLVMPAAQTAAMPHDVAGWSGWSYLQGASSFPKIYPVDGDWSSLWPTLSKEAASANAAAWPVRVFIFRRSEEQTKFASGLTLPDRATLEQGTQTVVEQSLARAKALLEKEAGGKLRIDFTVTVDESPFRYTTTGDTDDRAARLSEYLSPRINNGSFTANDQIYRGPYRSVLVFWPVGGSDIQQSGPAQISTVSSVSDAMNPGLLTCQILQDLQSGWANAAERLGWKVPQASRAVGTIQDVLNSIGGGPEAVGAKWWNSGSEYTANAAQPPVMRPMSLLSMDQLSPVSSNVDLKLTKVNGKSALEAVFAGLRSTGGFTLPMANYGSTLAALKEGKYLTFEVSTKSADSVRIGTFAAASKDACSIGAGPAGMLSAAVPADGAPHTVSVSLKDALAANPGASAVYIGFDPADALHQKNSYLAVAADFSDFRLTDAPAANAVTIGPAAEPDAVQRASQVWTWKDPGADDFQANFTKALADPSDLVRINAYLALTNLNGTAVMGSMIGSYTSINPMVPEAAAPALAAQKTPEAWACLVLNLLHGINPRSRAAAAIALGQSQITAYGIQMSTLLSQADWYARWAAVQGLTSLNQINHPGADPDHLVNKYIEGFLNDFNPQVRLAAIKGLRKDDDAALAQELYSAVNDGSDAVRTEAYRNVLSSGRDSLVQQALSGLSDDSWAVRVNLMNILAQYPVPATKDAIVKNLSSDNPYVRAAAITALGACDKDALSSLGPVLSDSHPAVRSALEAAAAKYGWKLPAGSVGARMNEAKLGANYHGMNVLNGMAAVGDGHSRSTGAK